MNNLIKWDNIVTEKDAVYVKIRGKLFCIHVCGSTTFITDFGSTDIRLSCSDRASLEENRIHFDKQDKEVTQ